MLVDQSFKLVLVFFIFSEESHKSICLSIVVGNLFLCGGNLLLQFLSVASSILVFSSAVIDFLVIVIDGIQAESRFLLEPINNILVISNFGVAFFDSSIAIRDTALMLISSASALFLFISKVSQLALELSNLSFNLSDSPVLLIVSISAFEGVGSDGFDFVPESVNRVLGVSVLILISSSIPCMSFDFTSVSSDSFVSINIRPRIYLCDLFLQGLELFLKSENGLPIFLGIRSENGNLNLEFVLEFLQEIGSSFASKSTLSDVIDNISDP